MGTTALSRFSTEEEAYGCCVGKQRKAMVLVQRLSGDPTSPATGVLAGEVWAAGDDRSLPLGF